MNNKIIKTIIRNTNRYSLSKKYKLFNWVDNNILWYVIDKPIDIYKSIKHWFYCNFNIYHWRLVKRAFLTYPWDGSFLYELEELQIDKQLHWFKNNKLIVDYQYNEIMRSLKLAKSLVHIINNEYDLYHFSGYFEYKELPQYNDNGDHLVEIKPGTNKYHYDGPKINKRTMYRFMTPMQFENINSWLDSDLYMLKVKYMYHKVRERYTDMWWD